MTLGACGVTVRGPTYPPAGATPPPPGAAAESARAAVVGALAELGFQATDATTAYRPPESASLAGAPRVVLDVAGPTVHGFVVLYVFPSGGDARAAGEEQAGYVSSGVGRAYFPPGTRFAIRLVGGVLVFYAWTPGGSADAYGDIAGGLERIGTTIDIPSSSLARPTV